MIYRIAILGVLAATLVGLLSAVSAQEQSGGGGGGRNLRPLSRDG